MQFQVFTFSFLVVKTRFDMFLRRATIKSFVCEVLHSVFAALLKALTSWKFSFIISLKFLLSTIFIFPRLVLGRHHQSYTFIRYFFSLPFLFWAFIESKITSPIIMVSHSILFYN